MKIRQGKEPLFCTENDPFYRAIVDLQASQSREQFLSKLQIWMPLRFNSLTLLQDWVPILNLVDSYIQDVLDLYRVHLILQAGRAESSASVEPVQDATQHKSSKASSAAEPKADDINTEAISAVQNDLCALVRFTSHLLRNSVGKELYNSAEHLVELLRAYDDELMQTALEALVALGLPPMSHRCDFELTRHFTALHKNASYFDSLFEVVDAAYSIANIHIENFLSPDFEITEDLMEVKVDIGMRSKYGKNIFAAVTAHDDVEELDDTTKSSNVYSLQDVREESRSTQQIMRDESVGALSVGLKFSVMIAIRMRRLLTTLEGRQQVIKILYEATTVLLGCYPDSGVLYNFFQDKIDLLKNFIYLLRTGPGSTETATSQSSVIGLNIRFLACQCLEAIIGARDNASSPIFVRYPWMLYDLGVHRGQYMGLFPCLLRSATSYLVSVDNDDPWGDLLNSGRSRSNTLTLPVIFEADEMNCEQQSGSEAREQVTWDDDRLQWIERILMLLIALVNSTTALPALTDNGLIPSILTVLQRRISASRPSSAVYVEILAIEILENAIVSHVPAMTAFKDQSGMETIVKKLQAETHLVAFRKDIKSVPVVQSIILQELLSVLSSTIHEGRQDMTDSRIGQWYRCPELSDSLLLVYQNPCLMTGAVLSPALQLLADVINNDPAPPTLHGQILASGAAKAALAAMQFSDRTTFTGDCLVSYLAMLSAVSLTTDGVEVVKENNPFQSIFGLFQNERYFFPHSRILMHDLPAVIGANIEELIRHHPVYLDICMEHLIATLSQVCILAESKLQGKDGEPESACMGPDYVMVLQFACALLTCVEPLLLKKTTVQKFLELDGVHLLVRLFRIGLGPTRYFIASLSCTIDSTVHNVGFEPLLVLTSRCINQISELETKPLLEHLATHLDIAIKSTKELVKSYLLECRGEEGVVAAVDDNNNSMHMFLDSVTREPLQVICEDEQLTPRIKNYSNVLRGFTEVDFLVNAVQFTLNARQSASGTVKECIEALAGSRMQELFRQLLEDLYLPSQMEMSRARGSFVSSSKTSCVKVHPIYHLLVVAPEHVLVKETYEDSSKRICKLGRGIRVEAFERKSSGANNLLKYRTNDGWISVYKGANSTEPQVLVLDVTHKPPDMFEEELARNAPIFESAVQRVDFEKFANVSARRGGFLGLFHFNYSVKVNLLTMLSRNFFSATSSIPGFRDQMTLSSIAPHYSESIVQCLTSLLPKKSLQTVFGDVAGFDQLQELVNDVANEIPSIERSSVSPSARTRVTRSAVGGKVNESDSSKSKSPTSPVAASGNSLSSFFFGNSVPDLFAFSTSDVYLAIRATELCHTLIFEHRRGRTEVNALLLAKLLFGPEAFLENLMRVSALTFLCSLPLDAKHFTEADEAAQAFYDGEWCSIRDDELDNDDADDVDDAGVGSGSSSSSSVEFKKFSSYLNYRRALRERRSLALSSVDGMLELWKMLLTTMINTGATTRSAGESCLFQDAVEGNNYNPIIAKRIVLTLATRYFVQLWSHEKLSLLPPATVKCVVDLLGVVMSSLHTLKALPLRSPPAVSPRSSRAADSSGDPTGMPYPMPGYHLGMSRRLVARTAPSVRGVEVFGGTRAAPPAAIQAEEGTIRILEDMGFARRTILRAVTAMRTNDANQLASFLLENPFIDDDPDPSDSAPQSASSGGSSSSAGDAASDAVSGNDNGAVSASSSALSSVESGSAPAANVESSDSNISSSGSAASSTAPVVERSAASGPSSAVAASSNSATAAEVPSSAARAGDDSAPLLAEAESLIRLMAHAEASARDESTTSSDPDNTVKDRVTDSLPVIRKYTDSELKKYRDVLQRIQNHLYASVSKICLDMIEKGHCQDLQTLDSEIKTINSSVTREVFTVMILNQMLKCLDRNSIPEHVLRVVELLCLFRRAISILQQTNVSADQFSALYGILHAILILLTSKTVSGSNTRASSHDLWFIILAKDPRFTALYQLLADKLTAAGIELQSAVRDSNLLAAADEVRLSWIAPAVMILDLVAQPILIDSDHLRTSIHEMLYNSNNSRGSIGGDLSIFMSGSDCDSSEELLTTEIRNFVQRKYFGSIPGLSIGARSRSRSNSVASRSNSSFDAAAAAASSSSASSSSSSQSLKEGQSGTRSSDTASSAGSDLLDLPLFDQGIPLNIKISCVEFSLALLAYNSSRRQQPNDTEPRNESSVTVSIQQAVIQFLSHLTRERSLARYFYSKRGVELLVHSRNCFEGFSSMVFTILQQTLEDEHQLHQAMGTAIRMCLLRLARSKTAKIPLKNLLEVVCPLVYRDQRLFLEVLQSCTEISLQDRVTYVSFKDPSKEDKGTSTTAEKKVRHQQYEVLVKSGNIGAAMSAKKESTVDKGDSAAKKRRTGVDSAVVTSFHATDEVGHESAESKSAVEIEATDKLKDIAAPTASDLLDTLLHGIISKWIVVKNLHLEEHKSITKQTIDAASETQLSISELLMISADLIVSLPQIAVSAHRYTISPEKFDYLVDGEALKFLPARHAVSGQPLYSQNSFTAFLIHALLLPSKIQPSRLSASNLSSADSTQLAAVISDVVGGNIRDSCCYFLAALCSRPGEGRKRILQQLIRSINTNHNLASTEAIRCSISFAKAIIALTNPPVSWSYRDVFLLPSKDILIALARMNAHMLIGTIMCKIDNDHPLALEATIMMSIPVDALIRKGIPALVEADAKKITAVPEDTKHSKQTTLQSSNQHPLLPGALQIEAAPEQAAAASDSNVGGTTLATADVQPNNAGTSSSGSGSNSSNQTITAPTIAEEVPSIDIAAASSSSAAATITAESLQVRSSSNAPLADAAADGSLFYHSPSPTRPRVCTDHSQLSANSENDERLLLSAVLHGAEGGDDNRHQHLMRPSNAYEQSSDDDQDDDDDDVDVDPDGVDARLMGGGRDLDVDHMGGGDEDDEEDEEEDDEDDEDGEEIEEDDDDDDDEDDDDDDHDDDPDHHDHEFHEEQHEAPHGPAFHTVEVDVDNDSVDDDAADMDDDDDEIDDDDIEDDEEDEDEDGDADDDDGDDMNDDLDDGDGDDEEMIEIDDSHAFGPSGINIHDNIIGELLHRGIPNVRRAAAEGNNLILVGGENDYGNYLHRRVDSGVDHQRGRQVNHRGRFGSGDDDNGGDDDDGDENNAGPDEDEDDEVNDDDDGGGDNDDGEEEEAHNHRRRAVRRSAVTHAGAGSNRRAAAGHLTRDQPPTEDIDPSGAHSSSTALSSSSAATSAANEIDQLDQESGNGLIEGAEFDDGFGEQDDVLEGDDVDVEANSSGGNMDDDDDGIDAADDMWLGAMPGSGAADRPARINFRSLFGNAGGAVEVPGRSNGQRGGAAAADGAAGFRDYVTRLRHVHDRANSGRSGSNSGGHPLGGIAFMNPGLMREDIDANSNDVGSPTGNGEDQFGGHEVRLRLHGSDMTEMFNLLDMAGSAELGSVVMSGHGGARSMTLRSGGGDPSDPFSGSAASTFQQLMSSMIGGATAPGMHQSAHVDPRTGQFTISYNRPSARGESSGGYGGNSSIYSSHSGAGQPSIHPLLGVTDARRNRFLLPNSQPPGTAASNRLGLGVSQSSAQLSLISQIRDNMSANHVLDSTNRNARATISPRRRSMGPIVSDRRWGTDIGDLEPIGSRLQALATVLEHCVRYRTEKAAATAVAAVLGEDSAQHSGFEQFWEPGVSDGSESLHSSLDRLQRLTHRYTGRSIMGIRSPQSTEPSSSSLVDSFHALRSARSDRNTPANAASSSARASSDASEAARQEESKEEGVLQESKDDLEATPAAGRLAQQEESKEEGQLQESKDDDGPSISGGKSSSSGAVRRSGRRSEIFGSLSEAVVDNSSASAASAQVAEPIIVGTSSRGRNVRIANQMERNSSSIAEVSSSCNSDSSRVGIPLPTDTNGQRQQDATVASSSTTAEPVPASEDGEHRKSKRLRVTDTLLSVDSSRAASSATRDALQLPPAADDTQMSAAVDGTGTEKEAAVATDSNGSAAATETSAENITAMITDSEAAITETNEQSIATAAEPVIPPEDPNASSENALFISSLPRDLREEVLLGADTDFLRSLPREMQLEAQRYQEQRAIAYYGDEIRLSESSSGGEVVASPVVATAESSTDPEVAAVIAPTATAAAAAAVAASIAASLSATTNEATTSSQSSAANELISQTVPVATTVSTDGAVVSDANAAVPEDSPVAVPSNSSSVALDIGTIMEDIRQINAAESRNVAATDTASSGEPTAVRSDIATTAMAAGAVAATASGSSQTSGLSREELEVKERSMSVYLTGDRRSSELPYSADVVARLLRSIFNANKSKLPRAVLKLIATACRYRTGRAAIVNALFASLHHDGDRAAYSVSRLLPGAAADPSNWNDEICNLIVSVDATVQNPLHFRRIICGLSFLLRKTDKLIWYNIVSRPTTAEEPWLFGTLLSLLANSAYATSVNLEFVLQLLEDICSVFSRLPVTYANELGRDVSASLAQSSGRNLGSPAGEEVAAVEVAAAADFEGGERKRSRTGPSSVEAAPPATETQASTMDTSSELAVAAPTELVVYASNASSSGGSSSNVAAAPVSATSATAESALTAAGAIERVRIPFPVLLEQEATHLCAIAGSEECGGVSRKRLMRIMRSLSLNDSNWHIFLDQLSGVAAQLARQATEEFSNVLQTLNLVLRRGGSAAEAMGHPELSAPLHLSEVKLLNVLKLMTVLRARSSDSAAVEADEVAQYMRRVEAARLWMILSDCLDYVRELEGIVDTVGIDESGESTPGGSSVSRSRSVDGLPGRSKGSSSSSKKAQKEEEKKFTLSALTMRFMPLIESFLSVCATTLLKRPDAAGGSSSAAAGSSTVPDSAARNTQKRTIEDTQTSSAASSSSSSSFSESFAAQAARWRAEWLSTPAPPSTGASIGVTPAVNRINSMLPGSRFRQHAAYQQMQLELRSEDPTSKRLISFVHKNRILFNNVLRNNVHLLEASFSPLISVPRCRQLLHFDVKRAYFKMKLKRMRQSAARMHGALRLSVRRQRVFEESFQALRYKSTDEMRRRLSITFHGEEGADAGGLTREWYSVLAREIFNVNYALFISTGDSVTFQPNPHSHVNPEHLSYFKFVGRVIGKAICDGQLMDAHFTRSFYKHILGLQVSVHDLEAIEPDYYKSLRQILETPLDLLGLDLTFSAEKNDFGRVEIVDLIPNGREVAVTDDTKHEYIKLIAHHRMTAAIRKQTDAFLEGFHELVPPELISIFDAQELELLISGLPDIDLDDLRAHTDYHGYKSTDPEISHFWSVLKGFSKQDKALFLQFVTGTSKVPLDGFEALQGADGIKRFNIHKAFGGANQLPSAHTCFNQLDLPEYPSEEVAREKLLVAIREGSEGFGFA